MIAREEEFMQELVAKYGKRVLLPGALAVICLWLVLTNEEPSSSFEVIETAVAEPELTEEIIEEPLAIVVDVKGAIHYPGVYTLTTEHRVADAIEEAGGYTDEANPQLINHAQKLQDEMVIYVPKLGEEMPDPVEVTVSGGDSTQGKVNINTADEVGLTTLPGIGPAKAAAIIAYRTEHGPFKSIDGLKEVSGIGDKTFEQLKDLIDIK